MDTIYCLPFFAKPGRHTYMIQYKNTAEKTQAKLLSQIAQLEQSITATDDEEYLSELKQRV